MRTKLDKSFVVFSSKVSSFDVANGFDFSV